MLTRLGVRNLTVYGDEAHFSCPFPEHNRGDERPSAYMNLETTAFICHGCKRRGNATTFVSEYEGVNSIMALRWLREAYGSVDLLTADRLKTQITKVLTKPEKKTRKELKPLDPAVIDLFYTDWFTQMNTSQEPHEAVAYMKERGFDWYTLDEWQIGIDTKSQRIAIPYKNEFGRLVGFKGRTYVDHEDKYITLVGEYSMNGRDVKLDSFPLSECVFGLDRCVLDYTMSVILCEGELNAMSLWKKGYQNVIAISGSWLSERQAELIIGAFHSCTLLFDSDKAGIAGTERAVELLAENMLLFAIGPHDTDPADMSSDEIDKLLQKSIPYTKVLLSEKLGGNVWQED